MNEDERERLINEWNFDEAPVISKEFPGPNALSVFSRSTSLETPQTAFGSVLPLVPVEAKGAVLKDVDDNFLIDFCASIAVVNVGHQHPEVVNAIVEQAGKLGHIFDMTTDIKLDLISKIRETAPIGLKDNCFVTFTLSGTDAACAAVKQMRKITGRKRLVAFTGGYHGVFGAALAMATGNQYREGYGPLAGHVKHLPYPYCYRCPFNLEYPECGIECAHYADSMLNDPYTGITDVAALVLEPVQGEGGYVVPPAEWFPIVKKACDKNGCFFVSDEVQCGFGRTGRMWAIDHFGIEPDCLIFGKGVGGDQPVTGVMMPSEHRDKLEQGSQPITFSGNAISMAAAGTNFKIMTNSYLDLMGRATILGEEMQAMFTEAQKRIEQIGDIRGMGLMQGLELVKDPETKEPCDNMEVQMIVYELFIKGVIVAPAGRWGNTLRFMPPLTIKRDHFFKAIELIIEVITSRQNKLTGKKK